MKTETTKISVNEFKKILKDDIDRIAVAHSWDINKNIDRGFAFQRWFAEVVTHLEPGYDTSPDEACVYSKDLKADIVFDDTARNSILICQCKYQNFEKPVDETEVNDFFHRHEHFTNRDWIMKNGSTRAQDALLDYGEKVENGYSVTYYFVSTGKATERVFDLAEKCTQEFAQRDIPIRCELLDFTRLKEYYVRSITLDTPGPTEVKFRLPEGSYFILENPFPTIVAAIRGNELRALYQRYKESLYAWNIRGYLGNRGINHEIFETAQNKAEQFFYYNNGVSAICTDFDFAGPGEEELVIKNFQIINGAQTVSTLAKSKSNPNLIVLFRLTKTLSVKTEKGINRDIIRYNNSQNIVRVSDFRSNDDIQKWLEDRFRTIKNGGELPPLFYIRKRSVGRKGFGTGIRLEDFAKIRYAFLKEPTLIHSSPKRLWSLKEDDGVYEVAFGVDGEIHPVWSNQTFQESLLAIAFYLRIDQEARDLAARRDDLRFMRRLRFHALSLAGIYAQRKLSAELIGELLLNKQQFDKCWREFWPICATMVEDGYSNAEEQNVTMFAFVRSEERWQQMVRRFNRRFSLARG